MNLLFTDSNGNQIHYQKEIYSLKYSFRDRGGPLELTVILPMNLISPKIHLLDDVGLYDGMDEIWIGRVRSIPSITVDRQAAAIICEGYFNHLRDDRYKPAYTMPKTADQIIKDVLTQKCPKISSDQTQISAGAFSIAAFDVSMSTTPATLIERANAFEGYDWGFYDRGSDGLARMKWAAHDRGTIDYKVSLRNCKPDMAGKSIEELYNKAYVLYGDFSETTSTASNDILDDAGVTRAISLSESSLTLADAQQVGDEYLAIKAKSQGKGQLEIKGTVRDAQGREIESHRIMPGKNIQILDLEPDLEDLTTMSSSDVLNGKNVFKISEVGVDYDSKFASVQLEMPSDRLDILIERLRA